MVVPDSVEGEMAEYAAIESEIAEGRVWRARELLAARVAKSDFDPDLFRRYAAVLQDMGDQDEAGRFYMLAGERSGTEGLLADQFLKRRDQALSELWAAMPDAARRVTPESAVQPMIALLLQAGYGKEAVASLISGLITEHTERDARSWSLSVPHSLPSETAGVVLTIAAAVIFLLGLLKLLDLVLLAFGY